MQIVITARDVKELIDSADRHGGRQVQERVTSNPKHILYIIKLGPTYAAGFIFPGHGARPFLKPQETSKPLKPGWIRSRQELEALIAEALAQIAITGIEYFNTGDHHG